MKMIYNGTPMKSLNIHHFEMDTNDCDMVASDLQVGKTAVARGRKITGTGKAFEFACYSKITTNKSMPVPTTLNVIELASLDYPILHNMTFSDIREADFSTAQIVGFAVIDGVSHPITVQVTNNILRVECSEKIGVLIFFGKDNYV